MAFYQSRHSRRRFLKLVTAAGGSVAAYAAGIVPEMAFDDGWQCFMVHQGERLPVVQSREHPILLGAVYKSSLLDAYFKLGNAKSELGTANN